ncbi:MAG: phosphoglyceromutase [Anaerolineae bacterium]
MARLVFVFLDGFGLAPAGPTNPLSQYDWPRLRRCLGAAPVLGQEASGDGRLLLPLDSQLGVPGLPQSATGQVALFTGVNAPALLGYHMAAYPGQALTAVVDRDNILKHVHDAGLAATFANAYSRGYFTEVEAGRLRHSATTLCVLAAGLPFRMEEDFLRGEAVYWDITGQRLRERTNDARIPLVSADTAGRRLAAIGEAHHLTLFECFLPDLIGHRKSYVEAAALAAMLDEFLGACADCRGAETTIIVSSDHGNVEDLSTGAHTANPVPLMAIGPAAGAFAAARDITDVAPAIYRVLGVGGRTDR